MGNAQPGKEAKLLRETAARDAQVKLRELTLRNIFNAFVVFAVPRRRPRLP
jgi:hypothetical protein